MRYSIPLLILSIGLAGCSEAPPVESTAQRTAPSAAPEQQDIAAPDPAQLEIAQAAQQFMRGIFNGDAQSAAQWLTPTAAQRYAANPEILSPLGFRIDSWRIGEVRVIAPGEAAVQCLITEAGAQGEQEIGCLLKQSQSGWGVCGLACETAPDQPPALISFEGVAPPAEPAQPEFVSDPPAQYAPQIDMATPDRSTYFR